MDPMILSTIVALAVMTPLLCLGVEVGVVLSLAGMAGAYVFTGSWSASIGLPLIQSLDVASSYTLMVIPLFTVMGTIAAGSGITSDLFDTFYRWFGRLPGGVAVSTIGTCAGMSSITGSSMAVSVSMAKIAVPELRRYKYDDRLSFGAIAMGGMLAIMIPPSITLILYAAFAEQSIGQMLMAGLLPGLLTAVLYITMIVVRCVRNPTLGPAGPSFSWRERLYSTRKVLPFLLVILAIIIGILLGMWTPTESAAVGLVLICVISFMRSRMTWASFFAAAVEAIVISAAIFMIVIGSLIFGNFIALNGLGEVIVQSIADLQLSAFSLFALIVVFYLLLGTFMETTSILALTVPLVLPVVIDAGWSPIWFGIILVSLMEIAAITPPVGLTLFVVKAAIPNSTIMDISIGSAPFWGMNLLVIILLYMFPEIALMLPNSMVK